MTKADPEELDANQQVHVSPIADLRHLDFAQILVGPAGNGQQRAQVGGRRGGGRAMTSPDGYQLPLRLAALGFLTVVVQIAAISQVTVFGVSADLSPLVVASVGLLAGSLPGAVFGFAVGLFVDLALVQTLGVSSLLLIAIGYWAGRLRELRDPAHGLVPLAVGAVATAVATGRLRADAVPARHARAGQLAAAAPAGRDDPDRHRCSRCRSTRSCAASCRARCRRTRAGAAAAPTRPAASRRSSDPRRAAEMTGLTPPEERRPPITPQLAMRVAILGGIALAMFAIVFFRLWFLQVLSGDQYLAQASTNRVRDIVVQAPRGEMLDRHGRVLVENRRAVAVVVSPPKLPQDAAARLRELTTLEPRAARLDAPAHLPGRQTAAAHDELDCLVRRSVWNLPYADVTVNTGRPAGRRVLPRRARAAVPRRLDPAGVPALLSLQQTSARSCSARSGRSMRES